MASQNNKKEQPMAPPQPPQPSPPQTQPPHHQKLQPHHQKLQPPALRPAETLFARRVPVSLRSPIALAASTSTTSATTTTSSSDAPAALQERRHPGITITVGVSSRNGDRLRVLEVRLTDDSDPHFLFYIDIAEDDFHLLKSQQNLLIDFSQFPFKFIELLEACIASAHETNPKFLAQLHTDPNARFASFSIVETNSFKHINHLSLQFVPGTDATVRQYLADLVKDLKADNAELRERLSSTGTAMSLRIDEAESKVARLTTELEHAKASSSNIATQLKLEHTAETARERERSAQDRESIRMAGERELRETERRHDEEINRLSQKLASITATQAHISQHAQSLEASLASSTKQNEMLSRERDTLRQDLERISSQQQQASLTRTEMDTALATARERIKDFEHHGREAEESIRKLQDRAAMLTEQKSKAEETAEIYKTQSARLEDSLKKASEEITKGNEIIRKLQTEMKSSRSKLKLKNIVTLQQEKLLDERAITIESLQKEVNGLKELVTKKTEECTQLHDKNEEMKKRLDEGKAIIEDNNHVIEWLHKQLNDEALSRPIVSGLPSSVTAGIAGIDFDKYATMASTGGDATKRSPSRMATAYRSRYVPQERTTSPIAQAPVQLPPRLHSPQQQPHQYQSQHPSEPSPHAHPQPSTQQQYTFRSARTAGLAPTTLANASVRGQMASTGVSPTLQNPLLSSTNATNGVMGAAANAAAFGTHASGGGVVGRGAVPSKVPVSITGGYTNGMTQPPTKSSYF